LNLQVHSLEQTRLGTEETLSLVRKQLSAQEETQEDLLDLCGRLQGSVLPPDDHSQEMGQGSSLAVGVRERLSEQEERLQALSSEMNLLRGDAELIPRVAMLVTTLKQVAPKVMDHELCLRDVLEKVGGLEIQLQMERAIDKASDRSQQFDSMVARTSRLEVELARITAEVEGGPTEAPSGPDEESPDEAGTATSRKLLGGIGTSAVAASGTDAHHIVWAKKILQNDAELHDLCDRAFAAADEDNSGPLDVNETVELVFKICLEMSIKLPEKEKIAELVNVCDKSKDGALQMNEFRTAFKAVLKSCIHEAEKEDVEAAAAK
ncbi:unnamed protein product, partial [Polarella glacialis]